MSDWVKEYIECREKAREYLFVHVGMATATYAIVIWSAKNINLKGYLGASAIAIMSAVYAYWHYNNEMEKCDKLSPLVLDLDGDGVEADALAYFDHEGDGWSELSRWANEDDGVLVWDRNNDGVINDGSELFGNNTALGGGGMADHGFRALSELDENGDGMIDAKDSDWANLRVMRWMRPGFWGFGESRLVW